MQTHATLPLASRDSASTIACGPAGEISTQHFLARVTAAGAQLPSRGYAVNLCRDRLNFFFALSGVIAAGQCNLLPPNGQAGTIDRLIAQYPDSYILHDGIELSARDVPAVNIGDLHATEAGGTIAPPAIAANQPAAISFTSGSTGQSSPNLKTWSMLLDGANVNAVNMLCGAPAGLHILATVPAQHMYGLELTITLPLVADVCMHSGQPLYPVDVQHALADMRAPRALVSTPQHLRALVASGLDFPATERIYSATAPLDQSLAQQVEHCFNGELVEIFGCSEIGSVARRRTAHDRLWTPFSSMAFRTEDGVTSVSAPHVPAAVELQDTIELHENGCFELKGRFGDLVNIAGKRGSLAQLNQLLLGIPGVVDGVVFDPRADLSQQDPNMRLAALVVSDEVDKNTILAALRRHVDPVFLPRPIVFTDALPRNETSKLPRQAVLDTYRKLRG